MLQISSFPHYKLVFSTYGLEAYDKGRTTRLQSLVKYGALFTFSCPTSPLICIWFSAVCPEDKRQDSENCTVLLMHQLYAYLQVWYGIVEFNVPLDTV